MYSVRIYFRCERCDICVDLYPRGVLPNKEVRGLGPHIKFGGKIWGKIWPRSPNKRKNFHHKVQKLGKSHNFGVISEIQLANLGYLSFIFLEAKFGAPTKISEAKFGAKPSQTS